MVTVANARIPFCPKHLDAFHRFAGEVREIVPKAMEARQHE